MNEFTANNNTEQEETDNLSALQIEKEKLEQQQLELKQKEAAIAKKLAEQKEKAATLEKKAIITKYKDALSLNIETYNRVLKQYGSSFEILPPNTSEDELLAKNKEEITDYFLTHIKEATNSYLAELNNM